jgi:hypothetical protein
MFTKNNIQRLELQKKVLRAVRENFMDVDSALTHISDINKMSRNSMFFIGMFAGCLIAQLLEACL